MATAATTAARTGKQFLDGLSGDAREIWLNGEKITHPLEHAELRAAAESMARVFDLQHEHADEMLAPSPDDGRLVNVTHLIPRTKEDLERRRRAIELTASATAGMMGRTPDYLNVTFACFAGRADVWARRGNEQGAANLVAYQKLMRDRDLSTTHSIMNPQVDRSKPEADQAMGEVALHKVGETADGHRRPRRPDAGDPGAVRRRADGLPRVGHPAAGRQLRAGLRHPDGDAGAEVHLPRQLLQAALGVRLPAVLAVRRDGRRSHLRRRRDPPRPRVPGGRPGGLLRGDHRHRLARSHHAPGVHARLRQALVRVRARPHDRRTRPASSASTTSRRSWARSGTWSS